VVLLVASTGSVVANGQYDVTTNHQVDTPVRTVTFQGDSFRIADLGRVDPGESVIAKVAATAGDAYTVTLHNAKGQEIEEFDGTGTDSFTFETTSSAGTYEPGTYVVAVHDSGVQAVAPVVIAGYHVALDAPSSLELGSVMTVEASVSTVDDTKPIDRVQVVIGNADDTRRKTLSTNGNGDYSGTFPLDTLGAGEYSIYVIVQGSQRVLGQQEVVGVSDSQSLQIESAAVETTDRSSEGASGGSGGSDGDTESDGSNGSAGNITTSTTVTAVRSTDAAVSTTTGGPTRIEAASTSTVTTDSVITPNSVAPATTTPGQPLGVLPSLAAFVVVMILAQRRHG